MNQREAYRRPSGYIDIHKTDGGTSYRNESDIKAELAKSGASSAVLLALSVRALDLGKDDLVAGYRRRNKLIFSKGVGKLTVGAGLFVLSGMLGAIALEANKNLEASRNSS